MTVSIADFPSELHEALTNINKDTDFTAASRKGQNGYVVFGTNKVLNRQVAIKLYYWDTGDHAEPELLAKLEHKNILKVYHAAPVNEEWAYYTTKHCSGGDIDGLLESRKLGVIEAVKATMDIASGVSFLHGHSYLHRDLKPENVFIDGLDVVIGDFGSVAPCDASGYCKTWTRHSLIYRPPEAIEKNDYYKASDIYQLGILLYQLCGGYFPYLQRDWLNEKEKGKFDCLSTDEKSVFATDVIEKRIRKGRIIDLSTLPVFVPDAIRSIIRKCTKVDRAKRYNSVAEMLGVMNNKVGDLPDWRVEGDSFVLYRGGKMVRVRDAGKSIIIEKDAGGGWRKHSASKAKNLDDAVAIAEGL